jgi:CIC family chloride channel protein
MAEQDSPSQDGSPVIPKVRFGIRLEGWISKALGGQSVSLLVMAALIGVAGGYGAILFRYLIVSVNKIAFPGGTGLAELSGTDWYWVVLAPAVGGLIVGPLVYFLAREAKGHGVPEVMDACANRGGRIRPRVALVKILASAVSIGSGGSVGREGPIVQIGSAVGSSVGQYFGMQGERLRALVATGAAAGIAATFNAPIAGVLFSIEIILGRGHARIFSPLVVGAVVATVITRAHLGNFPAFEVAPYDLVSIWELPLYVLLGAVAAFAGLAFTRGLYALEDLWDWIPFPPWAKAVFGGALVGGIAVFLPHVMGVGYEHIEQVLNWDKQTWPMGTMGTMGVLLMLMAIKIFTTGTTIGSGGSGGVFAPSLFIGASLGGAFGILANTFMPEGTVANPSAYALVAMGALVAATTHAPLTAILIVFELTDRHTIILPLMLSCILSHFIATRLSRESIYTLKLVRRGSRVAAGSESELMSGTLVKELTHPLESSLKLDTPLAEIVESVMAGGRIRQYVTDEQGRLQGVITIEDVTTIIRDEDSLKQLLLAADLMRPVVRTVSPDSTLDHCMTMFTHHHAEELPVVESDHRLIGWISQADAIALYNREILRQDAVVKFASSAEASASCEELVHLPTGDVKDEIPVVGGLLGRNLKELDLRARFGVIVYAVRHRRGGSTVPDPAVPLASGDTLVVVGPQDKVARVRELSHTRPSKK